MNTKSFKSPCLSTASAQASRRDALPRQTSNTTPLSAPAAVTFAAGRSPTRLDGRPERPISQPRRRFVPPSWNQSSPSISITSALKGTLANKRSITKQHRKQSRTIEESKPQSWYFDIFEESEESQDYRMCEWTMTQSSAALDISDDESKRKSIHGQTEQTDRGKENIDPNEASISSAPVTRAAAAAPARLVEAENEKDKMNTEEPRTPLGDLKTADYYGEGLDATSVVLVHDEEPIPEEAVEEESPVSAQSVQLPVDASFTFTSHVSAEELSEEQIPVEEVPEWAQRNTLSLDIGNDASAEAVQDDVDSLMPSHELDAEPVDIEIWESESAKDENENAQEDNQSNSVIVWEGETVSASAFCLQEL